MTTDNDNHHIVALGGEKIAPLGFAFAELRQAGYFARMDFWCCQSCGWAAVPKHEAHKVVFFHNQDTDQLIETGQCYVAWAGDREFICDVLKKHGIVAARDGDKHSRIKISLPKTNPRCR